MNCVCVMDYCDANRLSMKAKYSIIETKMQFKNMLNMVKSIFETGENVHIYLAEKKIYGRNKGYTKRKLVLIDKVG